MKRFAVKITTYDTLPMTSYLSYKSKNEWCRKTAKKYADDWKRLHNHLGYATLEEV